MVMEMFKISMLLAVVLIMAVSATDLYSDALIGLKSELLDSSNSMGDWTIPQNPSGAISACSWSVNLNISQNSFSGRLPVEIFSLANLTSLDISRNNFSGEFPAGISALGKLSVFDAFSNSFPSSLPEEVVKLDSLKVLNLTGSYFDGPIPPAYGSFKSLEFLHLAGNSLQMAIPPELGMLQTLTHMEIGYNLYKGHIPWQLGNMSSLQYLDIAGANLSGPIPENICNLTKLHSLFMFRNQLTGWIPWCFGNITPLQSLDLSDNFLSGSIPETFASLISLRLLSLMYNNMIGTVPGGIDLPLLDTLLIWNNYFSGPLPQTLGKNSKLKYVDASTNGFTGSIPPDICAGGMLTKLILFSNNFTGGLSPALTNCSSLIRLRLEDNSFSGKVSLKFSLLPDITYVDLSRNRLSEGIPIDISEAIKLEYFNVSKNPYLGGMLPNKMWSLPQLENLSASSCGISGSLPPFMFCESIIDIELNANNISRTVPDSVAKCKALERMSLGNNHLTGDIPMEFASIPALTVLDLSHNEFTGEIPVKIQNSCLVLLNVSFNDISGIIPSENNFQLMGASAFIGNPKLCGAPLQTCPDSVRNPDAASFRSERKGSGKPTWVVLACAGMALFILISIIGIFYLQRERGRKWKTVPFIGLPEFEPGDILKSFSHTSSIETPTSLSTAVNKAVLPTGITVIVKKIEWDDKRRARMEELINQLGGARHKNLIRLLGLCCNKHVAFLLYDYLPNGNLDEKTRKRAESPLRTWAAKYKLVIGIARSLCYLHHDRHPAIPHGDLKTSNIVFDEHMEPCLVEFGLKTLIQINENLLPTKIFKTGFVSGTGEIDKIMKEELSRDIYSFGEVVLEILSDGRLTNTGERVHKKTRESVLKEIYDENEVGTTGAVKEEIKIVLEVALLCTRCRPSDRPSMNEALKLC